MSKVVLFIATSLDGFIASPDGTVDWLAIVLKTGNSTTAFFALLHEHIGPAGSLRNSPRQA